MGITFKIDVEAGVIYSVGEGEIGAADIRKLREQVRADPLYHPNLSHLFDGRSAQISYSGEEAWAVATWGIKNRPTAKTAVVVDKEALGYARMYLGWRGETNKIFHDMASAREWLGLPPEEE